MTRIEVQAFHGCHSLGFIRLPRTLVSIGAWAFNMCTSLEAVYLPPTVTYIGLQAFNGCTPLRCFYVPEPIEDIGYQVFLGCGRLLATININVNLEEYEYDNDLVNQRLMQQPVNLRFHQACFSTSANPQGNEGCFEVHRIERATEVDNQQMTALHILWMSPHVTGDALRAYLQLAPEAAEQEDSDGMTPFQYLCRNDINFLEDRSFSALMAWWYGCMPPQTESGKKRQRE